MRLQTLLHSRTGDHQALIHTHTGDHQALLHSRTGDHQALLHSRTGDHQALLHSRTGDHQALLHAQGVCTSRDHQEDPDETGTGVDSTVSELDNQALQKPTPAHTLRLLHLSEEGTLVQHSLLQSCNECLAPTQDNLSKTTFIAPNSTNGPEAEGGDKSGTKADEPMETDAASKPRPSTSTPVSRNSPGVLEKTLSLPSQPESSHDVLVATQSLAAVSTTTSSSSSVAPRHTQRKPVTPSLRDQKPSPPVESSPSALPLRFTVNTESSTVAPLASEQPEDESQATQIEGLDVALCIDTGHSVMSRLSQRSEPNGVSSSPKTAAEPKAAPSSLKHSGEGVTEERAPSSQRSEVKESMPMARNVTNVNVSYASGGSPKDKVHGALLTSDVVDPLASNCVQQTPQTAIHGSLASMSQSVFSQTSSGDSVSVTESELNTQSLLKHGQFSTVPCQLLSLDQDVMDEGDEAGEEEEEKEVGMVKEGENILGSEGSALGLALSRSQVLSPEPLKMEGREEGGSLIVGSESERSPGPLQKKDALPLTQQKRSGSQPEGSKVSTNGQGAQSQPKDVCMAPDSLSQADREGPEANGVKDKSLSDSSGEIPTRIKEEELIGPAVSATPPLINQLQQTPSTPTGIPTRIKEEDLIGPAVSATPPLINQLQQTPSTPTDVSSMTVQHMVVEPQKRGRGRPRKYPVCLPSPAAQRVVIEPKKRKRGRPRLSEREEHHRQTSTQTGEMASKRYSTLSEVQREIDQGRGLLDARMQPVVKLYRIDFLLVQEESELPQIKEEQDGLLKRPIDGFLYIGHQLFSSSTQEVEEQQRRRVKAIFDEKSDEEEFLGFPDLDHASKSSKQTHSLGRRTGKKNCICAECGKGFRDKSTLNMHTMMHTGEMPHTCRICGKGCITKGDLTIHMRTHTGLKPFTCTVCYKGCRQMAHLKEHMKTHTGERPVTCTICGKGCFHNGQLKAHMRSHTGEKPFICITCGKGFSYLNHLKRHWMIHTGEKPFTCKVCGKGFSQKIDLQKHMWTHTGERPRPFKCTLCGKALTSKNTLRIHTMMHKGETPLKCNVCGKGCREMGHLNTHMRTHTGEKPFICTVCGKAYSQSSHLRTHMNSHTRGTIVAKAVV